MVEVDVYEIDPTLRSHLETTLASYAARLSVTSKISSGDFISEAARQGLEGLKPYSHAILNPPYKRSTARRNTA